MFNVFEKIGSELHLAVARLRVRSALNPMLWLCGITSPLCLTASWLFLGHGFLTPMFAIAGLVPIGITCLGFVWFALFKPEKLQSEDYQIRHEALQIIQDKSGQLILTETPFDTILNPAAKMIEHDREGKE